MVRTAAQQQDLKLAGAVASVPAINTWDAADEVGREYALLEYDIEAAEAELNALITDVQKRLLPRIQQMKADYAKKESDLKAFAKTHRADFGSKKSRKLNFITLLFKKTSERVALLADEAIVIANVKKAGHEKGVVKVKESLDKKALAALPEQLHRKLGFEVVPTGDVPEVKVDRKVVEAFRLGGAAKAS